MEVTIVRKVKLSMGEQKKYQGDNRVAKRNRKFYNSGVKIKTTTSGSAGTESDGRYPKWKRQTTGGRMKNDRDCLHRRQRWQCFLTTEGYQKTGRWSKRSWSCQKERSSGIHPFSEKLFEQEHPENCCVDENFSGKSKEKEDICFVENPVTEGNGGADWKTDRVWMEPGVSVWL